jgi:hypothetical protein
MLTLLQQQAKNLDDATLETIANKGLVRRARKDFDLGECPEILSDTDESLTLSVSGEEVTLNGQGLPKARCTCPAVDICRHILIAGIWLRSSLESNAITSSTPEAPSFEYLLDQTLEDLTKWAGKRSVKDGVELFYQVEDAEVDEAGIVAVQFPGLNVTSRFFSEGSLQSSLCTCKSRLVCLHQVAAVLLYQKAHDRLTPLPERDSSLSQKTPQNRSEVLHTAKQLLTEMVSIGICHLSDAMRQRCVTLSVSATGVDLPRLSRSLRTLSDDLQLSLDLDAKADQSRLFLNMARTYALCCALEVSPRSDLVGWHRTQYDEVGTLELAGLGAYHWRSQSGYVGITVLFWDMQNKRWCSWSDSRPVFKGTGFSPQARYKQPMPWLGLSSPEQASHHCFRLVTAKRNYQGRLSSSDRTAAQITHAVKPAELNFGNCCFENWGALHKYAIAHQMLGLRERNLLQNIVVIRPTAWGERSFDPINQTLYWSILDVEEREIFLQVAFQEHDRQRLQTLEKLDPQSSKIWGIVAQLHLTQTGLYLSPVSLLYDREERAIVSLSFSDSQFDQDSKSNAVIDQETIREIELELETPEEQPDLVGNSLVNNHVVQLITELEIIADQGRYAIDEACARRCKLLLQKFEALGLETIAQFNLREKDPASVLKLRYVSHLLARGMGVAEV